jgi:hypothetical protein
MKRLKKVTIVLMLIGVVFCGFSQKKQVAMTMELKPVLQIDMITEGQIDFVFNSQEEFSSGIVKKAATVLKVTSTVNWDMYAVGRTSYTNGGSFWSQEQSFKRTANSVATLPLSLLELRQGNKNNGISGSNGIYNDYSQEFSNETNGGNSIYVPADGSLSPPSSSGKYIAGHSGVAGDNVLDFIPAGSYDSNSVNKSDYYYEMDYRVLPGYPAIFPNATNEDATVYQDIVSTSKANSIIAGRLDENYDKNYTEPGMYTMTVQYIILEDQ